MPATGPDVASLVAIDAHTRAECNAGAEQDSVTAEVDIRDEVRPLVLKQNAARLLGL